MKNNAINTRLYATYLAGFFAIILLPVLSIPPWLSPGDFGKTMVFRIIIAVMMLLFAYQWLDHKTPYVLSDIKYHKIAWGILAVAIAFLIATTFSVDLRLSLWGSPARSGGLITFFAYIIFALFAFLIIKKEHWKHIWHGAIATAVFVCFVAIIQFYNILPSIFIEVVSRPPSTLGNPDFLAMYLLLIFFPTLYFFLKERVSTKKWIYLACLTLFSYTIIIAASRAVFLGMLVGGAFFVLFYPKKLVAIKIGTVLLLALVVGGVYYANIYETLPFGLEKNKFVASAHSRLSVAEALNDARFYSWQIAFEALKDRPITGFGPENFAVGFDRHYDPTLPYINSTSSDWWDRAHNILFDIGVQTGIIGIFAYFGLLITIFFQLQKVKGDPKTDATQFPQLAGHTLQAGLIAYVVANIFSFDGFSTYSMFFLLVAYSMHITGNHQASGKIITTL